MKRIDLPISPQRILIIKPSSLGDVVHTLPALNLLRKRWPDAHIAWLIGTAFAGLIKDHPQLDEIIPFDRSKYAKWWRSPRSALALSLFLLRFRKQRFDLVIDLQGLLRSGWLTWLTSAKHRIGFSNAREFAHLFYTDHVLIDTMEQHAVARYLTATEQLGCGREPVEFDFDVQPGDRAHIDELLGGIGPFALLLPGANWTTKRWDPTKFAELIMPLRERFGLASVIGGGPDVLEIAGLIPGALNAAGKTTLRQLVALTERASLVISNDTGPMHIAAALGKPLVVMFGPTNPIRTGPYERPDSVVRVDIPCSPCYARNCSHTSCMKWLEVESVLQQAAKQLPAGR